VVQKRGLPSSQVVLTGVAAAAVQTWAAFVSLTPTVMVEPTMCNKVVQEALQLLQYDDMQLQRVRSFLVAAHPVVHLLSPLVSIGIQEISSFWMAVSSWSTVRGLLLNKHL
jgi:hypothetical protein